ncbi:MAG: Nramp family divalent metal transporter [Acidobacteriota bacterium]|nr:Nramp family divalent metal transporter [Acidobacteriota bacterium]
MPPRFKSKTKNSAKMKRKKRSHEAAGPAQEPGSLGAKLALMGPGLITGASDDDPSGIATYSQAGAQFGFATLWLALFSYPFMCAIQEISARIGRVTGVGISANIRKAFPRPVGYCIVAMLLVSSIFNLGADLGAMGESAHLLFGGPAWIHLLVMGLMSIALQIFVPYTRYVKYLKFLAISLLAYVITAFLVHIDWRAAAFATVLPPVKSFHGDYLTVVVAVLGTTISPYLFFWQASQEAEEVTVRAEDKPLRRKPSQAPRQLRRIKIDTYAGMAVSNAVAFFIMLTAAATLHAHGNTNIQSAAQAATALEPLAGRFAYALFSVGIIVTGLLAVPVLAGAAAYAVGEAMHWRVGLEIKPAQATKFYVTLGLATLVGLLMNFVHFDPIKALFIAAVINGVLAAPVMALMMLMTRSRKIMGQFRLPLYLQVMGWAGTVAMFAASVAFLMSGIK